MSWMLKPTPVRKRGLGVQVKLPNVRARAIEETAVRARDAATPQTAFVSDRPLRKAGTITETWTRQRFELTQASLRAA